MSGRASFFSELKGRNVCKPAVAYVVTDWTIAEGASQIFPVFAIAMRECLAF
jgi:hypothetical protein